jgi:hypothetical protein
LSPELSHGCTAEDHHARCVHVLGAAESEPINFHTLTPVELSASRAGAQIPIEGISVPPQRPPADVIRQGNNGLAILETQWWERVWRMVAQCLERSTEQYRQSMFRCVNVQRFDSIPGHYGLIDVKWRLRPSGGGQRLLTCHSTLQTPSGPSIDELVARNRTTSNAWQPLINQAAGNARCPSAPEPPTA